VCYIAFMDLAPIDYIAPELALDKYNPENLDFHQTSRRFKQLMVAQQAKCRSHHVQVAKLHHLGKRNGEIAHELSLHAATVGNILKRDEVKLLIDLLRLYGGHMGGPTMEHKRRILWEITIDNKEMDPKTALQAIDQMNKMDGVYTQKVDLDVRITIDDGKFKQTALDQ
jgi:hypothetical protein